MFFIGLWTLMIAIICYITFFLWPGYQQNFYYICVGKFPSHHDPKSAKVNIVLEKLAKASFVVHILVGVRYLIFKYQENRNAPAIHSEQMKITCELINKQSLPSFSTNFAAIAVITVFTTTTDRMGRLDKHELESMSEYIWVYVFAMYDLALVHFYSVGLLLKRNKGLRDHMKQAIANSELVIRLTDLFRG
jgi:hypothetical protein